MWDNIQKNNISEIKFPRGLVREWDREIFEVIMVSNFTNLVKNINLQK